MNFGGASGRDSISVVIPVYNDQANLNICIAALASQTLPESAYEVIVVDNGSQPGLVLANVATTNVQLAHCYKPGSYAARNVGVRLARADVIAFLDADCVPARNWLETGLDAVRSAPAKTLIGGDVKFVPSEKPGAVELYQKIRLYGQQHNIEKEGFAVTANLFVLKRDILEIGDFNEDLFSGGDKEWCWRAIGGGFNLRFCPQTWVSTTHRKSLAAVIAKTRRVTGGRFGMKKGNLFHPPAMGLEMPQNCSPIRTFLRLLNQSGLSLFDQVRILAVAVALKLVEALEVLRLKTGLTRETRA